MTAKENTDQQEPRERLQLYTVGHSSHPFDHFVGLLLRHHIDTVVDVRSQPHSKLYPQYNRETLRDNLRPHGIRYAFMGDVLGGRPNDLRCYDYDGRVNYDSWSRSPDFQEGLTRLIGSLRKYRVALLCAEEDPNACHRKILIVPMLVQRGLQFSDILHIRRDGTAEDDQGYQLPLLSDGASPWRSPQSVLPKARQSIFSND